MKRTFTKKDEFKICNDWNPNIDLNLYATSDISSSLDLEECKAMKIIQVSILHCHINRWCSGLMEWFLL